MICVIIIATISHISELFPLVRLFLRIVFLGAQDRCLIFVC